MIMRFLLIAALFCAGLSLRAVEGDAPAGTKPYPLATCLIMDEQIDSSVPTEIYQGQEFKFCCKGCIKKFRKNPDKYVVMLTEKVAAQQKKQ